MRDSLDRVAALEPGVAAVAELERPMQELSRLRDSLDRVAALGEPMARVARIGGLLERPALLILVAGLGLGLWGAVTFLAVRSAILSTKGEPAPGEVRR
jgi:hypothetical protein